MAYPDLTRASDTKLLRQESLVDGNPRRGIWTGNLVLEIMYINIVTT